MSRPPNAVGSLLARASSRKFVPVIGVLTLLAAGCGEQAIPVGAATNSAENPSRPEHREPIVCRAATWDFGTVDQTKTREVAHTFRLENTSDQTVQIEKIEPTCGCIVSEDYPKELAPGSTADVAVRVNIVGQPGGFRKFVNVRLLGEPPTGFRLTIVGQVMVSPAFHLVPTVLDFGTLEESEVKTRTVKIARYDGSPVRFVETESESDALSQVQAVSGDKRDSLVELTLSLDSSRLNPGDFQSRVVGQTLHTDYREVTIPVRAKIAGQPSSFGDIAVRQAGPRHVAGSAAVRRKRAGSPSGIDPVRGERADFRGVAGSDRGAVRSGDPSRAGHRGIASQTGAGRAADQTCRARETCADFLACLAFQVNSSCKER
jgi:hypothetical protein